MQTLVPRLRVTPPRRPPRPPQQAVDIALDHAQVNEADTSFLHTEQDHEHGRLVYEVEFYVGQTEYKYEIDASTGKILGMELDHDH